MTYTDVIPTESVAYNLAVQGDKLIIFFFWGGIVLTNLFAAPFHAAQ